MLGYERFSFSSIGDLAINGQLNKFKFLTILTKNDSNKIYDILKKDTPNSLHKYTLGKSYHKKFYNCLIGVYILITAIAIIEPR